MVNLRLLDRPWIFWIFWIAAFGCWIVAIRGWKAHLALISIGISLAIAGPVLFFVMPQVFNAGSGQDAVGLFATVAGGGTFVVGLFLFVVGLVVRKS